MVLKHIIKKKLKMHYKEFGLNVVLILYENLSGRYKIRVCIVYLIMYYAFYSYQQSLSSSQKSKNKNNPLILTYIWVTTKT